jgi:alanine racemase
MSYNSQIGVPISILQMHPQANLGIFEAGISQPDEMAVLAEIIQPTIGVFTHIGSAHAENFVSQTERINEKWKFFAQANEIFMGENDFPKLSENQQLNDKIKVIPSLEKNKKYENLATKADRENAALVVAVAKYLGISAENIAERLHLLSPVQMRLEMITDNPEITLINDAYNSDRDSILNAFQLLKNARSQEHKKLIISDILHQGNDQNALQKEILKLAEKNFGTENIYTIGKDFQSFRSQNAYLDTSDFIQKMNPKDFQNSVVLLKGARSFELERIIPFLNHKLNATIFKINLNALINNLRYFKALVPKKVKMMCMVKAFSYGSGTWEIAEILEKEGVDFLAVAYISEAMELREKGIKLPIMVMNPDISGLETLVQYDIQPEIYSFELLEKYVKAARLMGARQYPLHLKLDTGMGRLGFTENDLPQLTQILLQYPDIQVVSIFTHLAAADDESADDFTLQQLQKFDEMYQYLHQTLGIFPIRHALNTSGILRFPKYAGDMVRLGIGLYGVNPTNEKSKKGKRDLQEIGTLVSSISQIHEYPENTSVGYGRSQFTTRKSRIATIPIGYADGIFRALSNGKGIFKVHGQNAPIFGRVCMDMIMLDITDIPEAKTGDEVLLFGQSNQDFQSVNALAAAAGTIAYEVLTRISPRVRRVYVRE